MSVPVEAAALLSRLIDYLSTQLGEPASLRDAKPLSGGASRDTWLITVQVNDEARRYVVRRDLPTQMFEEALTRDQEFRLMDAAYKSGVRVAQVLWSCTDESILGSPFFGQSLLRHGLCAGHLDWTQGHSGPLAGGSAECPPKADG
jgi:aminoglycoside phosphotransferase (APT) family kinase protein